MKRRLPILIAAVVALVAFVSAFAVNTGIQRMLGLPEGAVLATIDAPGPMADAGSSPDRDPSEAPRSTGLSRDAYVRAILQRNIFDHTKVGLEPGPGPGNAQSDLSVRLLGTIVAQPAEFSSALLAWEGKEGRATGYGIGDKLQDAEIVAIEQKKVTIRRGDGRTEYLTMDGKGDAPPPPAGDKPAEEGAVEGVSELGEGKYEVDRALIDKYTSDLESLSKMARAIPHRGTDGEIDGYRLSGIRRNSLASQLGIRNGDVIHTVNGKPLASMQEAMAAYQELQTGSSFNFEVTRRGAKQTLEYTVK